MNPRVPTTPQATTASPAPVKEPDVDESTDLDETWKVVVWDDPVNLIEYVVWVLQKVFHFAEPKARKLTMQVHNEGKAIVSDGPKERSEMYAYQLQRHGLWATIEQ